MATTNHERVGKSLTLLKACLGPFVERELKARYGEGWAFEAKEVLFSRSHALRGNAVLAAPAALPARRMT